jgi:hypothetical protein
LKCTDFTNLKELEISADGGTNVILSNKKFFGEEYRFIMDRYTYAMEMLNVGK